MNLLVYVAGAYSGKTNEDVQKNVNKAINYGNEILQVEGCYPFVPHLFHYWEQLHPKPYQEWLDMDMVYLSKCDILFRMPGESSGADAEEKYAVELGIPIVHSLAELRKSLKHYGWFAWR